jgi:hypothetical protein
MEKKFKLSPPASAKVNFIHFELHPGNRQDEFKPNQGIPVSSLTEEEAIEYGELMKQTFIEHWRKKLKH